MVGVVNAVGAGVSRLHPQLAPGVRVAGLSAGVDKPLGTFADEVVLSRHSVALFPDGVSPTEAATVPLNGLTALQAVELFGSPKGVLLVTGAAGGVGGYACALAV